EVQVKYEIIGTVPPSIQRTVRVELFYIYDGTYTPGSDIIEVKGLPQSGTILNSTVDLTVPSGDTFGTTLGAQIYRVYTDVESVDLPPSFDPGTPIVVVNYYRGSTSGPRLDCSKVALPTITSSLANPGDFGWQGAEANDPCVNEDSSISGEWSPYTNPGGTLVPPYQNSVYAAPSSDISKVVIRGGLMQSIGELGYIHTPTPWQHLTLQPGGGGAGIPDWAILDAFTVGPTIVPNVTRGRININSFINPGLATPAPSTLRLVPLKALLNSVSASLPATAAQYIYDDARTEAYGMNGGSSAGIFDTIGEICEISSLIPPSATLEKDKEATIRRIANLLTVRSNIFTIWAIAQSIKEPNLQTGQMFGTFQPAVDLITGEVKLQAIVERYENPPGTVRFRTKYYRYWYQ
ncbi:MAG: hypothetical protein ABSA97_10530, partial [Verrucomicrobiia bacterium]